MKKKLFFASLFGIVGLGATAQAPAIQWQKCYGGTGSDVATSIKPTSDGGYIVAGSTSSTGGDVTGNHGGSDIWVLKIDANGTIQWQKAIGGTALDEGYDVAQAKDGGYYVAGYSLSNNGDISGNHGGGDAVVVRLSANGTIKWAKAFGGTSREQGFGIAATHDGGCVVDGGSASSGGQITGHHGAAGVDDMWMAKVDSAGTLMWNKCLGGAADDGADAPGSVIETADHGFLIAGNSLSTDGDAAGSGYHGASDWLVIKLDSVGTKQWAKSYGGSQDEDPPTSLLQTKDGGYIMIGNSMSNNGQVTGHHGTAGASNDVWVLKISSTGVLQWQKSLGGSAEDNAEPGSISATADGGFLISSTSYSTDGNITGHHGTTAAGDYWLAQIDSVGTLKWQKSLGGTGDDVAGLSLQTADMGFIVVGGGASNSGDISGDHGSNDFWIVKLSPATGIEDAAAIQNLVIAYPNPGNGLFTLSSASKIARLEVMNELGQKVYAEEINSEKVQLDLSREAKGVYFYTLTTKDAMISRGKLIVQ